MKTIFIQICFLFFAEAINAQRICINTVSPSQDIVGASRNTIIAVEIDKPIDLVIIPGKNLFKVYGVNSGLVKGRIDIDTLRGKFFFVPDKPFYCGEIINASFGPLISPDADTLMSFNWRFTIEITNPTNANFDSLKRFEYPSFYSIANDFDNDGDIDIVSATGRVIYNDGTGSFNSYEEIEQLIDLKYLIDVNNDTILDIITSSVNAANVFLGDSSSNYRIHQNIYSFSGLIIAKGDINGDGFVDLIAKDGYGEDGMDFLWSKLINDGKVKFLIDTNAVYLENEISEADLIDMDKDGDLDLVLLNTWPSDPSTQFEGAYIYYNDGLGNFTDSLKTPFLLCPDYIYLSDLRQLFIIDYDLNGLNDIAGFGSLGGGLIILQDSNNSFCGYVETAFAGAENFAFFTSGDVNGDNRFDLIVSNLQVCKECGDTGKVQMGVSFNHDPINFWSDSANSFYQIGIRRDVGVAVVPVLADVDDDGDLDVIHTGYPTTVTYNENVITDIEELHQPPSSFSLSQNYPNPFN
ncbi:MAG: VCBS repeat-containing protein, partial [Bacteroidota bacterium]